MARSPISVIELAGYRRRADSLLSRMSKTLLSI